MEQAAFGPFLLDAARGTLSRDGAPVPLGQRALAVLAALAEAAGRTVAKEELLARAWPGAIVEEGNLTVQIAALRKAMGEGQGWILTVPRVGYRLAAPAPAPGPAVIPSLAVLPFANLGADPEQEWFSDGVVDDIVTALSRFRSFAVVARTSSFAYKGRATDVRQVARELGVRYVLEGSVRRAGDTLRISAQLVDGGTGAHLWAERFDGSLDEVFDFQDRITADVAFIVEPQIQMAEIERSRRERPGSIAAYDACLQAIPMINKQTVKENAEAYALLTRALAQEPNNPLLLSHAAWALGHRSAMGWPRIGPNDAAACVEFARRALHYAAGDPIVMAHSGLHLMQTGKEYDWGMSILESAAQANPNHQRVLVMAAIGHLHCGSLDRALAYFHRATSLSPNAHEAHAAFTGIAHAHVVLGNHAEALVWASRSLAINTAFDPTYWMLVAANAHLGRMEDARRHLAELRRLEPEVTVASIRAGQCAKDPGRIEPILAGLRLAGLPEA
jgi:TolB-like protein/Tfp pilus assembly protein PilF